MGTDAFTVRSDSKKVKQLDRLASQMDRSRNYLVNQAIDQLLEVIHRLRDNGNTIVVIEHNLDVIKTADWIVDLGPEGGDGGGEIIVSGTPEQITQCPHSFTGQFLRPVLQGRINE